MSMTPEELSRLRELCEKATPGPWFRHTDIYGGVEVGNQPHLDADLSEADFDAAWQDWQKADVAICELSGDMRVPTSEREHPNAEFIAAARTALPQLLDEVERLQNFHEELNNLRLDVENMAGQADDQWKASGLDALGTMLRMWFLEEGQERKQTLRRQATALNEANKLLDQTIEVLERDRDCMVWLLEMLSTTQCCEGTYKAGARFEHDWLCRYRLAQEYLSELAKPLLDNLKARKKEMGS